MHTVVHLWRGTFPFLKNISSLSSCSAADILPTAQLCNTTEVKTCGAFYFICVSLPLLLPPSSSASLCILALKKPHKLKPATSLKLNCLIQGPTRKEISQTRLWNTATIHHLNLGANFWICLKSVFSWMFLEMTTKAEHRGLQEEISQIKTNWKIFLKTLPNYILSKMFMNFETSWWAAVPRGRCLNP